LSTISLRSSSATRRQLERRVEERTTELTRANAELERCVEERTRERNGVGSGAADA
jgi:C4-dicarboxylate-specific signal transduction histidine kinase